MMNSSSTLVATVSINYEDFTEGFLTCGTCLYAYDQDEHTPKLLSCSHTICHSCLERIADSPSLNQCEPGCIRCPICRQTIAIPDGGVGALPPSFLVNQLFDLVNRKPREFIPKCSVHISQELLFCETCDSVFCNYCTNESGPNKHIKDPDASPSSTLRNDSSQCTTERGAHAIRGSGKRTSAVVAAVDQGSAVSNQAYAKICRDDGHSSGPNSLLSNASLDSSRDSSCSVTEHTVVPFSLAIKRMTEILQYRSQQCLTKLNEAQENVQHEIEKLESNSAQTIKDIERSFDGIKSIIDKRRKELVSETKKLRDNKRNVLQEQLKIIENEKVKLAKQSCQTEPAHGANQQKQQQQQQQQQPDVKKLTKKISDLVERNDTASALYAPRENCFISFKHQHNNAIDAIANAVKEFGNISTSKTYPPYCTATITKCATWLKSVATVQSIDYNGMRQKFGGDPISAHLRYYNPSTNIWDQHGTDIVDQRDGTYEVIFTPPEPGRYQLVINVFNRPIKDSPLEFETSTHLNPICTFGTRGKELEQFYQPVSLAICKTNGRLYVLDSFNCRIKVLGQNDCPTTPFTVIEHIESRHLSRSSTGLALIYHEKADSDKIEALGLPTESDESIPEPKNPLPLTLAAVEAAASPSHNLLVTNWRDRVIVEMSTVTGDVIKRYTCTDLEEPTQIAVNQTNDIIVVDRKQIFIFDSLTGKVISRITHYVYEGKLHQPKRTINKRSLHKQISDNGHEPRKPMVISNKAKTTDHLPINTTINDPANADKKAKSKTLKPSSGLKSISMNLKSGTLQRGSKAVFSAASRIRSSFTLPHSSSLVSAVSLQSMFNKNQQQESDPHPGKGSSKAQKVDKIRRKEKKQQSLIDSQHTLPTTTTPEVINEEQMVMQEENEDEGDLLEPIESIGAIAVGPNDELIVADTNKIRILTSPGYRVVREITIAASVSRSATCAGSTFTGLCYDEDLDLLLCTKTDRGRSAFIQVIDYSKGTLKFNIDSQDDHLQRPSALAVHDNHVVVADLGADCIKKYRHH